MLNSNQTSFDLIRTVFNLGKINGSINIRVKIEEICHKNVMDEIYLNSIVTCMQNQTKHMKVKSSNHKKRDI